MVAVLAALATWQFRPSPESSLDFTETATGEVENPFTPALENPSADAAQSSRLVYPYSVVAGGVHRPEELRQAVARDRVVAAHFSDFDVARARVVKLATAKKAYVSYRLKNRVYWTKKKVTLAKGETLLTDGKNYARTRCANRVSESAQAAISPEEPSTEVLDTPLSTQAPALMAYLPSAVRHGLAPDSTGGSGPAAGPGAGNAGQGPPSNGFFGGPGGYGGGAFLPTAGGGSGAPSGGSGSPGAGGGFVPPGTSGDTGGAPSPSNPVVPAAAPGGGTETGTPGGPTGNTPGGNPSSPSGPGNSSPGTSPNSPSPGTPGVQPPGSPTSTPPKSGGPSGPVPPLNSGGPTPPSSPGGNPFTPPGQGSDPGPNLPSGPSGPETFVITPSGDEPNEPPVDVTTPPDEGSGATSPPAEAVPEPGSFWLLGAGAAGLWALRKRKK